MNIIIMAELRSRFRFSCIWRVIWRLGCITRGFECRKWNTISFGYHSGVIWWYCTQSYLEDRNCLPGTRAPPRSFKTAMDVFWTSRIIFITRCSYKHLRFFVNRCSNFFLPVNWHDHYNRDITRTRTIEIIWVYSHLPEYPTDPSHSVTSGLFPVLSDVENLILKKFLHQGFAMKFQG